MLVLGKIVTGFSGPCGRLVIKLFGQAGKIDLCGLFEFLIVIFDHVCRGCDRCLDGLQSGLCNQRSLGVGQRGVRDQGLGHVKGGIRKAGGGRKAVRDVSLIERLDLCCGKRHGNRQVIGMLIFGVGIFGSRGRRGHRCLRRAGQDGGRNRRGLGMAGPNTLQAGGDAFCAKFWHRCGSI